VLRQTVQTIDQLAPGMELRGTVLNVVEFGCFIDIGMREAGRFTSANWPTGSSGTRSSTSPWATS
jgi:hypothetical protein